MSSGSQPIQMTAPPYTTPHYASGSPLSLRSGAAFCTRFYPAHSPGASLLGPIALPGAASSSAGSSSMLFKPGTSPCVPELGLTTDYSCCGAALPDMHALLEHWEACHADLLAPSPAPTLTEDDFEMEMELDSPADSPPPHTPLSLSSYSSLAGANGPAPYPYDGGALAACAPGLLSEYGGAVSPAQLYSPAPSRAPSPPRRQRTSSPTSSAGATGSPKPFACPKPGCNKSYKQANGLKYHLQHGQCNFAPRDPAVDALSEAERERRLRPFVCRVGRPGECGRRYKNMNGLRYHYQHTGEHGAVGLEMLAQGTHELPRATHSAHHHHASYHHA